MGISVLLSLVFEDATLLQRSSSGDDLLWPEDPTTARVQCGDN